jgi:hypothetical protein
MFRVSKPLEWVCPVCGKKFTAIDQDALNLLIYLHFKSHESDEE